MPILRLLLSFALVAGLRAQGTLDLTPAQPRLGQVVAFSLRTATPPASVLWDFGDGSVPLDGGMVTTHVYRRSGSFTAQATWQVGGSLAQAQRLVAVTDVRALRFTPATPVAGARVTFTAVGFLSPLVRWSFGDGASLAQGAPVQDHVYQAPGSYSVRAQDGAEGGGQTFTTTVTVLGQGPAAPFAVSYLALRWADGTTDLSVPRDEPGLVAYADLKVEGTGILQAQWRVDDRPYRSFSLPLGFAQRLTLGSGSLAPLQGFGPGATAAGLEAGLPTGLPGEHRVTLQVLAPAPGFEIPVLRYFVSLADPDLPDLSAVDPVQARGGQELELQLTGRRFREGMRLLLGRDLAQVAPMVLEGPTRARVRIYVAPAAKPGPRSLQMTLDGRRLPRGARLQVLPPEQKK